MSHPCKNSYFEVSIDVDPPLQGCLKATILEGPNDTVTNRIIYSHQNWKVRVEWELTGALVPCFGGYWCLELFMESIGPGKELKLPHEEIRIPLNPCGDGKYSYDMEIPAGTIKAEHCSIPYKPVLDLTYIDLCERKGPMGGFFELPTVKFQEVDKQ